MSANLKLVSCTYSNAFFFAQIEEASQHRKIGKRDILIYTQIHSQAIFLAIFGQVTNPMIDSIDRSSNTEQLIIEPDSTRINRVSSKYCSRQFCSPCSYQTCQA